MPKKYKIIYADPPWSYKDKALAGNRGAGCKYDVMDTHNIALLPVGGGSRWWLCTFYVGNNAKTEWVFWIDKSMGFWV